MKRDDVIGSIVSQCVVDANAPWWIRAAKQKIISEEFFIIPGRLDHEAYVGRFWLTPPISDGDGFTSTNSFMLHWFLRGDDDGAYHDHPSDFESCLLSGGFDEISPTPGWDTPYGGKVRGPILEDGIVTVRRPGTPAGRYSRKAADPHSVKNVLPGTWTLIKTGPKVRDWGFWLPGGEWVPWRTFILQQNAEGANHAGKKITL